MAREYHRLTSARLLEWLTAACPAGQTRVYMYEENDEKKIKVEVTFSQFDFFARRRLRRNFEHLRDSCRRDKNGKWRYPSISISTITHAAYNWHSRLRRISFEYIVTEGQFPCVELGTRFRMVEEGRRWFSLDSVAKIEEPATAVA